MELKIDLYETQSMSDYVDKKDKDKDKGYFRCS